MIGYFVSALLWVLGAASMVAGFVFATVFSELLNERHARTHFALSLSLGLTAIGALLWRIA